MDRGDEYLRMQTKAYIGTNPIYYVICFSFLAYITYSGFVGVFS